MRSLITIAALTLSLCACESTTTTETSGSGGSSAGGSGSGANGSGGGGTIPLCPSSSPTDGDACDPPANASAFGNVAHCSWGDDPRPDCRTRGLCTPDGTWRVTSPAGSCSEDPLPADCPAPPPSSGSACSDSSLSCWYASGERCWCSECEGGSPYPVCQTIDPPEWACATPRDGCPDVIPQAGSTCSTEGLSCGPNCELDAVCEDGAWVWKGGDCPMCAAPNTPIATPSGDRPISDLRAGDLVYSVHDNAIVPVPVLRASSTRVVAHRVMRVTLESGVVLNISPGHPTADGRTFAQLRAGGQLDGSSITSAELVAYPFARTYDILPSSDSGTYYAGQALIGSTLRAR